MKTSWFTFLLPPQFSSYEKTQKTRLLHYLLLASFLGALVFGIINFLKGWYNEATFLSLFAVICLLGFFLNRTKFFQIAALILCGSLYLLLNLMLYYGIGLRDETLLAFPLLMVFAAFLFGQWGLWITTTLSVSTVVAIHYLQMYALFENKYPASSTRVFLVSSLFVFTALAIGVVRVSWEMNLKHLRQSYDLTLHGWARALEYHDGETAGHTRRVTALSVKLAQKLGLSKEEIQGIEHGAYLHDIGKMAIPDNILLKPGKLTEDEWMIMKQHPVISREIIAEIPYLRPAIDVAYSHHERWDGTGYPEGLHGEEIPLSARIFAVIDNWDALNFDRPYRKAWPSEDVIAYLQGNAGTLFDPEIVEAFLEILDEDKGMSG